MKQNKITNSISDVYPFILISYIIPLIINIDIGIFFRDTIRIKAVYFYGLEKVLWAIIITCASVFLFSKVIKAICESIVALGSRIINLYFLLFFLLWLGVCYYQNVHWWLWGNFNFKVLLIGYGVLFIVQNRYYKKTIYNKIKEQSKRSHD